MANTTNTVDTLNGLFKESYADKVKDLTPEGLKLLNMIKFQKAEKQPGNLYHQPLVLGMEHGFTYGGAEGEAFLLNNAVSSPHRDAQVRGHEIVLRSYISVGSVSRSSKNSFEQSTKRVVQNMLKSFSKRLEIQLLYGQMGIGSVASISGATITITGAEWAAGIWSGGEGMPIEIRSAAGALRGSANIESVNLASKTITLDAAPAGVVSTDVIWFKGAYNKEFAGLHKIITNTGTLFNVDASSYSLFSGNSVAVGGVLTFAKVEEGIAKAMEKGLAEDDVVVLCSPLSWKNLLTEQAAKRQYDSSFSSKEIEVGAKAIKFHGPNGMIEIHSSIHVKEGYAYMFVPQEFERIGSSDTTFEQPGFEGKFFKLLEGANGYELRAYCDQALFTPAPGLATILTGVTNS